MQIFQTTQQLVRQFVMTAQPVGFKISNSRQHARSVLWGHGARNLVFRVAKIVQKDFIKTKLNNSLAKIVRKDTIKRLLNKVFASTVHRIGISLREQKKQILAKSVRKVVINQRMDRSHAKVVSSGNLIMKRRKAAKTVRWDSTWMKLVHGERSGRRTRTRTRMVSWLRTNCLGRTFLGRTCFILIMMVG